MDERKQILSKIGTFFLFIGVIFMFIFVVLDMRGNTVPILFILGAIGLAATIYFKRISAPPPRPPSNRFEGLRKLLKGFSEIGKKKDPKDSKGKPDAKAPAKDDKKPPVVGAAKK